MRRLVRGYKSDADRQRDLLQEMHIELWRSLKGFDSGNREIAATAY
jgi:DNA-directed RNA polymerase specialized sigma24 family protein